MDRIIAQSEDEFRHGVDSLRKQDLAAIVNLIQREMAQEQDEFNRLTERLDRMDASSRDFDYLEKARLQSQARLTSLMNKSMICLSRKQSISDSQESSGPPSKTPPRQKAPQPPGKTPPQQREAPQPPGKTPPRQKQAPQPLALQPSSMHGTATLSSSVRLAEARGDAKTNDVRAKVRFKCPENGEESPRNASPVTSNSFHAREQSSNGSNSTAQQNNGRAQPLTPTTKQNNGSVPPLTPTTPQNKGRVLSFSPPVLPDNDSVQENGSLDQSNGSTSESPPSTPSARSLIANFERLSSTGDRLPPRRSSSTTDFGTAGRAGGLPHSASMAQLSARSPRRVEIVEKEKQSPKPSQPPPPTKVKRQEAPRQPVAPKPPPEAPKMVVELPRSAPAKPPPVREPEVAKSSVTVAFVAKGRRESSAAAKDVTDGKAGDMSSGGVVIGDEKVQPTPTLKFWDPAKLLEEMYKVRLVPEEPQPTSANVCSGVLDKLPDQKKKSTMLKTWKRRYFVADQGELRTFEAGVTNPATATPVQMFQLSGGRVEDLGELMIGIDDGCGRFVTLRCPTAAEHTRWLRALQLQASSEHRPHHVVPVTKAAPHPSRRILIVDIGSCGIRAGALKEAPTLPELHFPAMAAVRADGEVAAVGREAFAPAVRCQSQLIAPARADTTIENIAFERGILKAIFEHIFRELKMEPSNTTVLLSVPNTTSEHTRGRLCELLFGTLKVSAVAMCGQAMLALYAYGLTTGVVVDLGHRMEILPVTDGVVQKGGVSRQPFGGARIAESLNLHLSERGCRFHSETELLLTRFIVQQAAFVCQDPNSECDVTNEQEAEIDLSYFDLPSEYRQSVSLLANGRCRSTEGLFNPADFFGMDTPSMPRLVQRAIAACPMDLRRDLAKRIVLSGGSTLLPGLGERLERELAKLLPAASQVKVHAVPNRQHAAYLGANRLAAMAEFEALCVTRQLWTKSGPRSILGRWTV